MELDNSDGCQDKEHDGSIVEIKKKLAENKEKMLVLLGVLSVYYLLSTVPYFVLLYFGYTNHDLLLICLETWMTMFLIIIMISLLLAIICAGFLYLIYSVIFCWRKFCNR